MPSGKNCGAGVPRPLSTLSLIGFRSMARLSARRTRGSDRPGLLELRYMPKTCPWNWSNDVNCPESTSGLYADAACGRNCATSSCPLCRAEMRALSSGIDTTVTRASCGGFWVSQ